MLVSSLLLVSLRILTSDASNTSREVNSSLKANYGVNIKSNVVLVIFFAHHGVLLGIIVGNSWVLTLLRKNYCFSTKVGAYVVTPRQFH